ncbi:MAG: hypothetical protein M3069_32930 [Chloroflexota bacterium]|nr:hypothetical protein [Chloroflexota bacterium]
MHRPARDLRAVGARHRIENGRTAFAEEAAAEIERLVNEEGATRMVLAGDEVAMTPLQLALSARVTAMVQGEPLRLDIRTPRDDVGAEVRPVLDAAEATGSLAVADQLIGAVRGHGLGVAGREAALNALISCQVDLLGLSDG